MKNTDNVGVKTREIQNLGNIFAFDDVHDLDEVDAWDDLDIFANGQNKDGEQETTDINNAEFADIDHSYSRSIYEKKEFANGDTIERYVRFFVEDFFCVFFVSV